MKKIDYVIYHKGCVDGFSGFFVFAMYGNFTENLIIYPDVPSATKSPPNINNKHVMIIDVAYKKKVLEDIFKNAKKVTYIDHHDSNYDDVIALSIKYKSICDIEIIYDNKMSGCTLTWKYFYKDKTIPYFLKLIEDNDIGAWKINESRPFICALKSYYSLNIDRIEKWKQLLKPKNVNILIAKGKIMKDYADYLVSSNIHKYTRKKFPSDMVFKMATEINPNVFKHPSEHIVAIYNTSCPSIAELSIAALNAIDCDIFMSFTINIDKNEYVISMRSKYVDVGQIAKIFGGGGHKLAASFSFLGSDYTINDLFESDTLPRKTKK